MRIIEALCYRQLNQAGKSIQLFEKYFEAKESGKEPFGVGLYDYLHSGVTKYKAGYFEESRLDFEKQFIAYRELPDTYYYHALACLELNETVQAKLHLEKAKVLFLKGYRRVDPYTEVHDQVYFSDIEKKLKEISP